MRRRLLFGIAGSNLSGSGADAISARPKPREVRGTTPVAGLPPFYQSR
ncbi:MAG: hypothetical protein WC208_10105 [Gallionella sp.]